MKRSESVLVYGVTGVLAVILAVAIIFGGDPNRTETEKLAKNDSVEDANLLADDDSAGPKDLLGELLGDEFGEEDLEPVDGGAVETDEPDPASAEVAPIEVPLRTISMLGSQRTEQNPASGERFRFVRVQRGDSLSVLIQRWCPGTDRDIVAALNETVDLDLLRPDQEICLPWIDDEILLQAMEQRTARREAVPAVGDSAAGAVPATVPATVLGNAQTTEHRLGEGESLWKLAAARVGPKQATAYIEQILALNPQIQDAGSVRAGQKILLPQQ